MNALKILSVGLLGFSIVSSCLGGNDQKPGAVAPEFKTMEEAFRAAGFDPTAPGSTTFAVASDLHVGYKGNDLTSLPPELLADLNGMKPLPGFLLFNGDTVEVTTSFGHVPDA